MNILVIGGTGTMGRLIIDRLLDLGHLVTCFSRDEQKQRSLKPHMNLVKVLGDIRDYDSVIDVMHNQFHSVINLAALKCVDTIEENPLESIKTNVLGTQNVIRACEQTSLPNLFFTSTDKACYPINVYGHCKAIAESLVREYRGPSTVFRYGNVLGSRGSVLPAFVRSIIMEKKAFITSMEMTRFWIEDREVADKIVDTIDSGVYDGSLLIKLSKTMRVIDVAKAVADALSFSDSGLQFKEIGIRPGEKIHETLVTKHDGVGDKDIDSYTHERYEFNEFVEMIRPIVERIKIGLKL